VELAGAAECAATQIAQMDSVPFAWWCTTRAAADQMVSTKQKTATYLNNERNPYLTSGFPQSTPA
jgi:hypothetical protein